MNNRDVQQIAVDVLARQFQKYFGLSRPAALSQTSNRKLRAADGLADPNAIKQEGQDSAGLSYPLGWYRIASIDSDPNIPQRKQTRWQAYGAADDEMRTRSRLGLVRVVYTIDFLFVTRDLQDILRASGAWHFAREGMGGRLGFVIDYNKISLPFRVKPDLSFAVPEYENDESAPVELEYTGQLLMYGYVSNVRDPRDSGTVPLLRESDHPEPNLTEESKGLDLRGNKISVDTVMEEGTNAIRIRYLSSPHESDEESLLSGLEV
jgi:hypothetical protein